MRKPGKIAIIGLGYVGLRDPARIAPMRALAVTLGLTPSPLGEFTAGKAVGGVKVLTLASAWSGLVNPTPSSVQPKQG